MMAQNLEGVLLGNLSVSRETERRLRDFALEITRWSRKINLVSAGSLDDLWKRHILDSAQLVPCVPKNVQTWVDLGAGGGLPGVVVAILFAEMSPSTRVVLIESDIRKAAFLATIVKTFQLDTTIRRSRIEATECQNADVVSARALAPLTRLLGFAYRHCAKSGTILLPKGKGVQQELDAANGSWQFDLEVFDSASSPDGRILKITNLKPKAREA